MSKLLDHRNAESAADSVIESLDDMGYTAEEAIPGLINAIIILADKTNDPEQALDEAANLLADGGVTN